MGFDNRDGHSTKVEGIQSHNKNLKSIGYFQCSRFLHVSVEGGGMIQLAKEEGLSLAGLTTERAIIIRMTETVGRIFMYYPADSLRGN